MRFFGIAAVLLISNSIFAEDNGNLRVFLDHLSKMEFEEAKKSARLELDGDLSMEMLNLADIISNAGQTDRPNIDPELNDQTKTNTPLLILRKLRRGYISLYYDQIKGTAYREFHDAYQVAKDEDDDTLLRSCLLAMLEYHAKEIAQNSNSHLLYLEPYKNLAQNAVDSAWLAVYTSIFYTKSFTPVDSNYFRLAKALDSSEANLDANSPVLAHVFLEKAINLELQGNSEEASDYYQKALDQARDHEFLRNIRFSAHIKLMSIATQRNQFNLAKRHLANAKKEIDLADTLRSSYALNLYTALMMESAHSFDSAYSLLKKAYTQDFQLDHRRNTLEMNKLNVELETQEKENANLRLTQQQNWLITGLAGLGLLGIVGYLVYNNRLAKSSMEIQEKQMRSMQLEKLLKDQEITAIDQIIEAQEKERQRIANELHDHLGSHLASIKLYFQNLQQKVKGQDQEDMYQKTDILLEEAYQQVRTLAHARNAGVNSKDGLVPAVRSLASKLSGANNLAVDVEEHGMDTRLENSLEILLFRIIQELTTNVIKHANATEITINLTRHENSINLMVEDNGAGFDISQIKPTSTMGLHSIQKRVENLGGTVAIDSIANRGTTVIIDLPI